jgi:PiT family inorganic phosphate transporter
VITSAIMGVGTSDRLKAVRWGVVRNIAAAWVLTIPCAGAIAGCAYLVLSVLAGPIGSVAHLFGI